MKELLVPHHLAFSELEGEDLGAEDLLARHHDLMRSQSPEESCHVMTSAELRAQGARVFVGRGADGEVQAIGAFVRLAEALGATEAELKSMHCRADLRGQGAGGALLAHLIKAAQVAGITGLWLETGSAEAFAPARRLYERCGFTVCPPFGAYEEDPLSVFMTRRI